MTKPIAFAVLLLAGCDRPMSGRDAALEISDASADARINALETRTAELEDQLQQLREDHDRLDSYVDKYADAAIADLKRVRVELDRHDDNDKAFYEQINYLRALHNQGPMPTKK